MKKTDYVFVLGMSLIALALIIALVTAALHSAVAFAFISLIIGLFLILGCSWENL